MNRALRIDTLQWFLGIYVAIRGVLMLVVPHTLSTHVFVPIQPYLSWAGALQVLGGASLISVAILKPRHTIVLFAHLLASAALLQAAIGHFMVGTWTALAGFSTLGIGTAIAPFLPYVQEKRSGARELDLFALLMGLRLSFDGIIIAFHTSHQQFTTPLYDPIRPYLTLYGALYFGSGLALLVVYLYPRSRRSWFAIAHLFGGAVLWSWTIGMRFPTWNSVFYFGGLGTALALLPWLTSYLRRFDSQSLRTQLVMTLVGIVTLPLIFAVALITLPQEQAVLSQALALQESLAVALSQDIASYIGLHRAAVTALANQPDLDTMPAADQQRLLQSLSRAYADVVVFTTYDRDGNEIARSDQLSNGLAIADLQLYNIIRQTDQPILDVRISRLLQKPIFAFATPIRNAEGRFSGLAAGAIEAAHIARQFNQTRTDGSITAYLVDEAGRIIAHPDSSLVEVFTNYAESPPVAALLGNHHSASGQLYYWNNKAWQLAGYAPVPDLGWGVVIERPADKVLAAINARRNQDFFVLLLVTIATLLIGSLIAQRLTSPLTTLTYAANQLATGNTEAPLAYSTITEVARLSSVFGAMRDRLTKRTAERDRAEANLRRSEAKFRRLADSNVIGIIVADFNGMILEANEAFLDMVQYSEADLTEGKIHWRQMTPPQYASVDEYALEELKTLGVCTPFEKEYLRKDGTPIPIVLGAAVLESVQNRVIAFVLDLTQQKRMEQELECLLERERTAREEAESANRIKDEFLAVLSHELRSPLNPILGWAKLLRSRPMDPNTTERALETIERNARLQTQLIDDLLDVSRILRGKMAFTITPVNLVETTRAALETVRLSAEAKSLQIQFSVVASEDSVLTLPVVPADSSPSSLSETIALPVIQVSGDAGRLQQIAWNLLSNAVKFTPNGGQIEVRLHTRAAYAILQVQDTGKGISPDFLPHVFEYFRQADSTTTRKFGGLGLGLAIVRYLTELHGGSVQAESAGEDQGATFIVTLPLLSEHETAFKPVPQPLPTQLTLAGIQILVIDDEADLRDLIGTILQEHQAQVQVAGSAADAIALLKEFQPDLIISDIGMPETDGYMLLQYIRQHLPHPCSTVPAIALTAYAGEANQQRAIAAGFQQHLSKPVEPEILVQAVLELLQQTCEVKQV